MSISSEFSDSSSIDSIESLARKLKHYWSNIYTISPVELASFVKIKSNLLRQGVMLEEHILNASVPDLMNWLQQRLDVSKLSFPVTNQSIATKTGLSTLLDVDIDFIESERQEIRKQLFKEEIKIRIRQSVKNFSIQCNKKMSVWDIRIPASWDVTMDQSFLLSLYDKTFHTKSEQSPTTVDADPVVIPQSADLEQEYNEVDEIAKFTSSIIDKHNDFSLMRADLDQFLSQIEDITTLELGEDIFGDSLPLSSIIILKVLSTKILDGSLPKSEALAKLGARRKRLVGRLEDFLSVNEEQNKE